MENTKVPVLFQPLKSFNVEDSRFTKVKIWLMHLEENMNGSYFTKDVVEKAIPTLANTPIMGLLNKESGDFEGHEMALVEEEQEDGETSLSLKNLTVPYGVIPEFNNAQFEDRVGDDGVTREYLTVEGLLWNKWEEGIKAIKNKEGLTGQSMEITDHDGQFVQAEGSDEATFHFSEFKFDGACLLGDDVLPAMKNSTVELAFSDKVSKIIHEKLAVYAKSTEEEGGKPLELEKEIKDDKTFEEENKEEDAPKDTENPDQGEEETPEEPAETEDPTEPEEPVEEPEEEEEEETPEEPEPEPEPEEPEPEPEPEPETPEEPEPEPEEPSEEEEQEEKPKSEIPTLKEGTVTDARAASNEHDDQVVPAIERIVIGENVYSLEEAKEIMEAHFALVDKLHKEDIDNLFAIHSDNLSDEEIKELKADAYAKTKDEVETSIYAVIGRKAFSSKKEEKTPVFSAVKTTTKGQTNEPYGGILNRFKTKKESK